MTRHEDDSVAAPQAAHATLGTEDTPVVMAEKEKTVGTSGSASSIDEKDPSAFDAEKHAVPDVELAALDDMAKLDNDKVLETAGDFVTALVSSQDDPTLPINTFRMWFCGIGFAAFGSVLAMLFVSSSL